MVYLTKLLVVSSKTSQTPHTVFLPQPLNTNAMSELVIAYQNDKALHISSPKHIPYSCIDSHLLCIPTPYSTKRLLPLRS